MTISTTANSTYLAGTSAQYTFNYSFIADAATDISAYYVDAHGNQTLLSPTQYTLVINAASPNQLWGVGGTITYPLSGSAIAAGTYLFLQRTLPLTQETSVQNQGNYYARVTEQALDILEMQIQQVAARGGQLRGIWAAGVQYNFGDVVVDGVNGNNTGNYYMCNNANLSAVWATEFAAGDWTLVINVQIIQGYATSAAASAATATVEAGIATTQASNASVSATNAASSASVASAAATTATGAATTATAQATDAAASAASASTSATTATTQAGIATTQATNAAASASSASTSATNAATSATNAAASAVAAGSTLVATSTTSNTIGTGNFTFTTQANKNFNPGQIVIAASNANGANYIHGYVASYSGTTLVITETDFGGSGAHNDWNISASGPIGPSGGGTGTVTTVSVATANGFSGTVSNPTTTPAITIMATPSGILKSNGTTISAAVVGTDYVVPTGSGAGLTSLTAANISAGTAGINITGNSATVTTISGKVTNGTNTSISGSGTSGSPYATSVATATTSVLGVVKPDGTSITISGGVISAASSGAANAYQSTPANPTGTTSATPVMMGLSGAITPASTGKIMLVISGDVQTSGASGLTTIQASYGTGAAPSNGASQTGTQVGGKINYGLAGNFAQGNTQFPFSVNAIVSGLTVSTAYWLDLAVSDSNGNTSTLNDISISAFEIK